MQPAISVVIPVYNVEKYLSKCIDSVLAQSFKDYEIILVDDGSADGSGKLCDDYAQKYSFISVVHQTNKGLGGARNTGIDNAAGKYILFLDSDDYIDVELLEICHNKAKQHDCDMVLFNCVAVYEDGSLGETYTCKPLPADTFLSGEDLKSMVFLSGACNRMFKSDLFKKFNIYFPDKLWYEDLHTVPKLIPHIKAAYYYGEKPLYYYFQRTGSIMHTPNFERITEQRLKAVNEIWEYYDKNGFKDTYRTELEYLWLFHGFFLPVREMQLMSSHFEEYASVLREELVKKCNEPHKNRYISDLNKKERQLLKWSLNGNYAAIKLFSALNKFVKKVRNVK